MSSAPVPPNPDAAPPVEPTKSAPLSPHLPPPPPPGDTGTKATDRIVVFRHSHLFYWWPVWLLGFIFAGITWWDGHYIAFVPANTRAIEKADVEYEIDGKKVKDTRPVLILDKDHHHPREKNAEGEKVTAQPRILMMHYHTLGTIYTFVLLLVIVITSVSIRGMWTVLVMVTIVMLIFIFWAAGWWETIFQKLGQLSIFINLGGYLLISSVLFVLWFVNFALFDRQTYMIFTPGQVRVRQEIGGEEIVYDVSGMVVQKARNDMFRHWILGFGSGDLTIKPVGVTHPIEFPNVLWVGGKVAKIENMIKEKVIVKAQRPPSV